MSKDYGSWSVTDLKNELRKRQAKVGGKKAALVQRCYNLGKPLSDWSISMLGDPEDTPQSQMERGCKKLAFETEADAAAIITDFFWSHLKSSNEGILNTMSVSINNASAISGLLVSLFTKDD